MGSAGFSVEYCTKGPIGTMDPALTMSGILSMGASATTLWPPASVSPVQKSIHGFPAGR
jgi:hypothetical protein